MARITIDTYIAAPPSRCFDLARNVELHIVSAEASGEIILPDASGHLPSGLLELGDNVTFRGRHFGITQQITSRITKLERPTLFRDSQMSGAFSSFDHDHFFSPEGDGTRMRDVFDFKCPFGLLGRLAEPIVGHHLKKFIIDRNLILKRVAESEQFKIYLPESH